MKPDNFFVLLITLIVVLGINIIFFQITSCQRYVVKNLAEVEMVIKKECFFNPLSNTVSCFDKNSKEAQQ